MAASYEWNRFTDQSTAVDAVRRGRLAATGANLHASHGSLKLVASYPLSYHLFMFSKLDIMAYFGHDSDRREAD